MRELNPWARRSNGREAHRQRYAAYMRSTAWFKRRERWSDDAAGLLSEGSGGIACLGCRQGWKVERDDLHHLTYARLGNEAHADLWPLCRTCHTRIHSLLTSTRSWRRLTRLQANFLALEHVQNERTERPDAAGRSGTGSLRDFL